LLIHMENYTRIPPIHFRREQEDPLPVPPGQEPPPPVKEPPDTPVVGPDGPVDESRLPEPKRL